MNKFLLLGLLLAMPANATTHARKPSSEVDCTKVSETLIGALVKYSQTDAFVQSLLKAEKDRLPESWSCESVTDWRLKKKGGEISASTVITCTGPDQHVNVSLSGGVEVDGKSHVCMVRLTDFSEKAGD